MKERLLADRKKIHEMGKDLQKLKATEVVMEEWGGQMFHEAVD